MKTAGIIISLYFFADRSFALIVFFFIITRLDSVDKLVLKNSIVNIVT